MNSLHGRCFRNLSSVASSSQLAAVVHHSGEKTHRIRVDQPPVNVSHQNSSRASISRLLDINYRSQVESFHRIVNRPDGQSLLDRLEAELGAEQRHDELKQLKLMISDIPFLMYLPSVSGRATEEPAPSHRPTTTADVKASNERRLALQQLPQSFTAYLGHLFKDMDRGQLDTFILSIAPDHLQKLEGLYRDVLAFGNYSPNEIPKRYSEISAKMDLLQAELQQVTSCFEFSLAQVSQGASANDDSSAMSIPLEETQSDTNLDSSSMTTRIKDRCDDQHEDRSFLEGWERHARPRARRTGSLFKKT